MEKTQPELQIPLKPIWKPTLVLNSPRAWLSRGLGSISYTVQVEERSATGICHIENGSAAEGRADLRAPLRDHLQHEHNCLSIKANRDPSFHAGGPAAGKGKAQGSSGTNTGALQSRDKSHQQGGGKVRELWEALAHQMSSASPDE